MADRLFPDHTSLLQKEGVAPTRKCMNIIVLIISQLLLMNIN